MYICINSRILQLYMDSVRTDSELSVPGLLLCNACCVHYVIPLHGEYHIEHDHLHVILWIHGFISDYSLVLALGVSRFKNVVNRYQKSFHIITTILPRLLLRARKAPSNGSRLKRHARRIKNYLSLICAIYSQAQNKAGSGKSTCSYLANRRGQSRGETAAAGNLQ